MYDSPHPPTTDDEVPVEVVVIEAGNEDADLENHFKPRKRKRTFEAWNYFDEVNLSDGSMKAICKLCKCEHTIKVGGPTTTLLRHVQFVCPKRNKVDPTQGVLGFLKDDENTSSVINFKYDHARVRKAAAYMILAHESVFTGYKIRDPSYSWLPSESDWERAKEVCYFLEIFKEVTDSISGRDYPTSNLFLPVVWKIKEVLDMSCSDLTEENKYIRAMAIKMKIKFDKYWGECNLLMAVAAVLDPRYKMVLINFCFPKIYVESQVEINVTLVNEALKEMYDQYVVEYTSTHSENVVPSKLNGIVIGDGSAGASKFKAKGQVEFDLFIRKSKNIAPLISDLDKYLSQGVFICNANEGPFDAINWWKNNRLNFKILSNMAVDILSIPISTVASEAAFSTGGRVIDPYRASLSTETVESLICGGDWVRALYGVKEVYLRIKDEDIEEIIIP